MGFFLAHVDGDLFRNMNLYIEIKMPWTSNPTQNQSYERKPVFWIPRLIKKTRIRIPAEIWVNDCFFSQLRQE